MSNGSKVVLKSVIVKSIFWSLMLSPTLTMGKSAVSSPKFNQLINQKNKINTIKNAPSFYSLKELQSRYASWGVNPKYKKSSINIVKAWQKFKKKKDIVIAVVDTGIAPNHPYLKKNIHVSKGKPGMANFGVDFSTLKKFTSKPTDAHGHGTHVSGIIRSVFPDVKILALKYYNPKAPSKANVDATIEALRYAVKMNVDIINYSGGGPEPAREELKILKEAERKGILVVAAAGNEQSNIDVRKNAYFPASYGLSNIITVTAHNQLTEVLKSSNWGKRSVDISAPGYRIKSSLPNGQAGYLTGTSQATAFVTGVAALLKSKHPKLNAKELKDIIKSSAKKEKSLVKKCNSGGRLDAGEALVLADKYISVKTSERKLATLKRNEGVIQYRMAN